MHVCIHILIWDNIYVRPLVYPDYEWWVEVQNFPLFHSHTVQLMQKLCFCYRPQKKLREGNVFTPLCQSFYSQGSLPDRDTTQDRDPVDRDPLDRDHSWTETPWTETTPGQRPTWTETPWTEIPGQRLLDRDPLDRDHSWTETLWTEILSGQRIAWTETPLDRDPPWTEIPLDRDPPGQRPPWTETSLYSNERVVRIQLECILVVDTFTYFKTIETILEMFHIREGGKWNFHNKYSSLRKVNWYSKVRKNEATSMYIPARNMQVCRSLRHTIQPYTAHMRNKTIIHR